jgi:hypothetical protein
MLAEGSENLIRPRFMANSGCTSPPPFLPVNRPVEARRRPPKVL